MQRLGFGPLAMAGFARLGCGLSAVALTPAYIQTLLNGFPLTITGGGQTVADYLGTLRKVNAGIPAIEGARVVTNLLTYSEDFSNVVWALAGGSVLANADNSPLDTLTADRVTEDTSVSSEHRVLQIFTSQTSSVFSVYAKSADRHMSLRIYNAENQYVTVTFNLSTGAVTQTNNVGGIFSNVISGSDLAANGYRRYYVASTRLSGTTYYCIQISDSTTPTLSSHGAPLYTGNGSSYLSVWGAQLEAGSTASEYVKTEATTASRAYDTTPEGLPLQPFKMTRTKNGTIKGYLDIPDRANSTAYALGAQVSGIATDGVRRYYTCTTAGTSHTAPPTWPTSGTVADNNIVWTYSGYATMNFRRYLGEPERTNLFLSSTAPATQNITTTAQAYTVSVLGTGSVTLSGTATGVASAGSPLTVTATAGTLTCTLSGTPTKVQVEAGSFATSWIDTAGATVTRPATVYSLPSTNVLRDQNWGARFRITPTASGQATVNLFGTRTDGNNYTELYMTATAIRFYKVVAAAFAGPTVNYTHTAGVPFEVDILQTPAGMEIRYRALVAGVWGVWSAWVLDNSATAQLGAIIAATYEIGSNGAGANQVSAYVQEVVIIWDNAKTKLEALL